jgi:hypothetical protein
MRFLCAILAFALAACGRADAATTDLPTLTVDYVQADSARVIARWARPCDAKGCADAYRVQWTAGAAPRLRTTVALADTLFVARPAVGDTLVATAAVTSVRRGIAGTTRTATTVIRNPDAPPPAVDSLRADTLTLAERAELDTFPVIVVRDTLGRSSGTFAVGEGTVLCGLARNRYTGEVRLFVPADAPPEADAYLEQVCERARMGFWFERDG